MEHYRWECLGWKSSRVRGIENVRGGVLSRWLCNEGLTRQAQGCPKPVQKERFGPCLVFCLITVSLLTWGPWSCQIVYPNKNDMVEALGHVVLVWPARARERVRSAMQADSHVLDPQWKARTPRLRGAFLVGSTLHVLSRIAVGRSKHCLHDSTERGHPESCGWSLPDSALWAIFPCLFDAIFVHAIYQKQKHRSFSGFCEF